MENVRKCYDVEWWGLVNGCEIEGTETPLVWSVYEQITAGYITGQLLAISLLKTVTARWMFLTSRQRGQQFDNNYITLVQRFCDNWKCFYCNDSLSWAAIYWNILFKALLYEKHKMTALQPDRVFQLYPFVRNLGVCYCRPASISIVFDIIVGYLLLNYYSPLTTCQNIFSLKNCWFYCKFEKVVIQNYS